MLENYFNDNRKLVWKNIVFKQYLFKRIFSVPFDGMKTDIVQHLETKICVVKSKSILRHLVSFLSLLAYTLHVCDS